MSIVSLTLVLFIYANDASAGKLVSSHTNNKSADEDSQQSLQRFQRAEFTVDLAAPAYSLLSTSIKMGDSGVERTVMFDTSLWYSWMASDELLTEHGLTAMPKATGLTVLEANVCHQYSRYELTGDWCQVTLQIGQRTQLKKFKMLLVKQSNLRLKFLEHIKGVLGFAPRESDENTLMAQTFTRKTGPLYLLISFNIMQHARVQYSRISTMDYPADLLIRDRVSNDRWSIHVDLISVGGTILCAEMCEVSFELGSARAYIPEDKRALIAGEWKVPVVEGIMELQESQLYLYEPLKVTIESLEFEWSPYQHHFTYTEGDITKYQSTILSHDGTQYALGTDYLRKMYLLFDLNEKKIRIGAK
ncbi:hypothetical protein CRM22_009159 [Opisthorchis felineus]|uniref:Peptidase A1 domain-containing protein n=1 Tax=Opisthorchis felineus TaxID=147828 RepID=A0A4S2LFU7_OPIFE|nr:hypothetical protein CRM22_009159 [Opisthorchis felineus]